MLQNLFFGAAAQIFYMEPEPKKKYLEPELRKNGSAPQHCRLVSSRPVLLCFGSSKGLTDLVLALVTSWIQLHLGLSYTLA